MDISKQIQTPEYDFLRNHPRLGNRIILLGPGGSYAYGTYQENSDLDIRGITLNLPSDLLGLTQFEQYEDAHTDTVIYSFNKIIRLLLACNPNTIEILGLDDDQYLIRTPIGQELLDHKHLFLSKRAAKSFGGYAGAQLRRLQNAVTRNTLPQKEREQHIYRSVKHALEDFERKMTCTAKAASICTLTSHNVQIWRQRFLLTRNTSICRCVTIRQCLARCKTLSGTMIKSESAIRKRIGTI